MNEIFSYWDCHRKAFYDPRNSGREVFGLIMPRLDWVRLNLAVTYGTSKVNTAGIPLSGGYDLSTYTSSLFVLKDMANYYYGESGTGGYPIGSNVLNFSNGGGFDLTARAWHQVAPCCVTLAPIVIPLTVPSIIYNSEISLLKTGQTWRLIPESSGLLANPCRVQRDVWTGQESNSPDGLPGGITGQWTIAGTATTFQIPVPNATVNCQVALGVTGSTGSAGDIGMIVLSVVQNINPLLNYVLMTVGSAPGTGAAWSGNFTVLNK